MLVSNAKNSDVITRVLRARIPTEFVTLNLQFCTGGFSRCTEGKLLQNGIYSNLNTLSTETAQRVFHSSCFIA